MKGIVTIQHVEDNTGKYLYDLGIGRFLKYNIKRTNYKGNI